MSTTQRFTVAGSSTADPAAVYARLADGATWSNWARPLILHSSWAVPGSPVGGVGAVRRLGTWPVYVREEILDCEQDRRHVYRLLGPTPFADYRGEVVLAPRPDGGTDISWTGSFVETIPGTGAAIRILLRLTITALMALLRRN